MSVTALDTHEVVKTLKAVGFSEEQAEAVTRVVRDSQNIDLSNLVTKADLSVGLAELRAEFKSEFQTDSVKVTGEFAKVYGEFAKIRTEMAEMKADIIKWVFGISIAQAGFVVALLRFVH